MAHTLNLWYFWSSSGWVSVLPQDLCKCTKTSIFLFWKFFLSRFQESFGMFLVELQYSSSVHCFFRQFFSVYWETRRNSCFSFKPNWIFGDLVFVLTYWMLNDVAKWMHDKWDTSISVRIAGIGKSWKHEPLMFTQINNVNLQWHFISNSQGKLEQLCFCSSNTSHSGSKHSAGQGSAGQRRALAPPPGVNGPPNGTQN